MHLALGTDCQSPVEPWGQEPISAPLSLNWSVGYKLAKDHIIAISLPGNTAEKVNPPMKPVLGETFKAALPEIKKNTENDHDKYLSLKGKNEFSFKVYSKTLNKLQFI